jgi:hypothetical protein
VGGRQVSERLVAVGRWFWLALFFGFMVGRVPVSYLAFGPILLVHLVRLHGSAVDDGPPLDLWAPIAAACSLLTLVVVAALPTVTGGTADAMRVAALGLGYLGMVEYLRALRRWCDRQGWEVAHLDHEPLEVTAVGVLTTCIAAAGAASMDLTPTWWLGLTVGAFFANVWALYGAAQVHWTLVAGLAKAAEGEQVPAR